MSKRDEFETHYPMKRNCASNQIGRPLADKAAELGPPLYDAPISDLARFSYGANNTAPDARSKSQKKALGGATESDLHPGFTSKNKLGGTPVRVIDKRKNSYNE
jgi:hypothetical protein